MKRHATVAELRPLLRSRQMLRTDGWSERDIARAVASGELTHLRRGWYMHTSEYAALWQESQHLAHVIAVFDDVEGTAAMSHTSAAVLWGLPLYRTPSHRVHMTTCAPTRVSSAPDVFRHVAPLAPDDVTVRLGIRTTTLDRTVFDLLRTMSPEAAIAAADAAERLRALRGRMWDQDAAARWRDGIAARIDAARGARGIRQARMVSLLADGRAQLPGESVSRLQLVRMGFAVPRLQVPVPKQSDGHYFVDFGLDDVNAFGEFDGVGKYTDRALRRGLTIEQVLLEEKVREDWIRGLTQRRFARWGEEHIRTPGALASRLAAFGIVPPT